MPWQRSHRQRRTEGIATIAAKFVVREASIIRNTATKIAIWHLFRAMLWSMEYNP